MTVCIDHFRVVVNAAQQIFFGDNGADEILILLIPDLIGHHPDSLDTQVLGQPLDVAVGLDAAGAGLNDHDKLVHHAGGTAAQMLQTGFHVHNNHIILAEDLLGMIHYNLEIMAADRNGKSPYDFSPTAIEEIRKIKETLDRDE